METDGKSPDHPWPVRLAALRIQRYIARLGSIWVEGEVSQLRLRQSTAFIALRDPDANLSIPVMAAASAVTAASVQDGHRVVVHLRPEYYPPNGSLTWRAAEFRPVGLGALMLRLEQLRKTLAAEGLFAADRKQPLPFLPERIGLICGRASAARHDVEVNARRQWPGAVFEVREVAVQGPGAAAQVSEALVELDAVPDVDVIIIARGGGSFEDLLPFSNEALLRAVSAARTPVVSAIGHEEDTPLLDLVADRRASTPTAAGRMVVPDLAREVQLIANHRDRARQLMRTRLVHERHRFQALRHRPVLASPLVILREQRTLIDHHLGRIRRHLGSRLAAERARLDGLAHRPVLARPQALVDPRRQDVADELDALRRCVRRRLTTEQDRLRQQEATLRALSPQHTLDRGYAVVRHTDGGVVRTAESVAVGERLDVRVAEGRFPVEVAVQAGSGS
jgi:exodeoxyribonuclease VII large subunit